MRLLKNGLPLWDVRVQGDGAILGEMIGTDRKVRSLTCVTTATELAGLTDSPRELPGLHDGYRPNATDIIVTIEHEDPRKEESFLLADVPPDCDFRRQCENLIRRLIKREAEQSNGGDAERLRAPHS